MFYIKNKIMTELTVIKKNIKKNLTKSTSDATACPLDKPPHKLLLNDHHLLLDHPDNRYGRPHRLIHPSMRVEGAQTQKAFLQVLTL